ncbi:hypothetical protein [Enhydrobacter sp.]|jgi:hypothetical protein|uniref:hypothetical protein n=1 Tax=Enhydrobacter sp. TaxID=1894999 RepID=UPI002612A8A9|nr:hypothetical protein [Enhydrobacter sp.]WIM13932.1 MAG: hypothetical protein OJF58_004901 [Enhydrobacter sp.]
MIRPIFLVLLTLAVTAASASAQYAGDSRYGRPERRDPIFLRFPEMAQRYWVNTETMAARHKAIAIPLPRQCAFVYADTYARGQMSEREVQDTAVSACSRKLAELGPLGENYNVDCRCHVVISDDAYVVPRDAMPDQAYGPASIFYRDNQGNVARLNGTARYGALIGHDRSVTFTVDNISGQKVCEGTFTNESTGIGRFSLSCFNGKFGGRGNYDSRLGAPNDHILARGQTASGQPIVMVIGLPAQLAANMYGGI